MEKPVETVEERKKRKEDEQFEIERAKIPRTIPPRNYEEKEKLSGGTQKMYKNLGI